MHGPQRTTKVIAGTVAAGVLLAASGCGSDEDYQNRLRPPALFVVTAAIAPDRVSVSPKTFGAGPISLIITNQTSATQQLTLQPTGGGPGPQQTGPINPQDTATLQTNISQGKYELRAGSSRIKPAVLMVGQERKSAQNQLLLP